MKLKKFFSTLISVIMIGCIITTSYESVTATQSRTDYFNKSYTLGSSPAENIVTIAKAQIGRTQSEMGYTEYWCADFVSDCAILAGVSNLIPANGDVATLKNNIIKAGGYSVSTPQQGDIVFYYCPTSNKYVHTGIAVNSSSSIEGNIRSQVYHVTGNYIDTHGHSVSAGTVKKEYVHPNYGGVVPPTPTTNATCYTNDVTDLTETNATLNGSVTFNSGTATEAGVYLGTSPDNMSVIAKDSINNSKSPVNMWFGCNKYGTTLTRGTTYYYQCYAVVSGVLCKGEIKSFRTPGNNDPIGYYDSGSGVDYNTIRITGWTFDPDEPAKQLYVHVYVGGNSGSANAERITKDINGNDIIANAYRQDVDDVHHCGAWHGIDTTIRTTKTGSQEVHIYAIDTAGGNNPELGGAVINIPADPEKPVISDVKITNITEDGYTVYCTVTDNHKLQRVSFPTWTTREENGNDQDDIVWHDYSNDLNTNSVTAWYRVKTSEHKNEHGYYRTHIYAYDQGGNWTAFAIGDVYVPEHREHIPADIFEYNGNIYARYDSAMTWTQANELCQQMGGHLVTISDQEESDTIKGHLSNGLFYWIGMYAPNDSRNFVWCNGEPVTFTNWNSGEPNDWGENEDYVQFMSHAGWNDVSNEPWTSQLEQTGFILEIENSAIQLDTSDRLNMNKYDFYKNLMPYSVAQYYANSKGGHLITITSAEENAFIAEKLNGWTWLALNDKDNEGTFKWTTGETLTYTNWNDGEPNDDFGEDNAAIKPTGQWNDIKDNNGYYFVIEYDNYYGDINSDGKIDYVDATLLLKHISDISKLNEEQLAHADVNNDKKIDLLDVIAIQQVKSEV